MLHDNFSSAEGRTAEGISLKQYQIWNSPNCILHVCVNVIGLEGGR